MAPWRHSDLVGTATTEHNSSCLLASAGPTDHAYHARSQLNRGLCRISLNSSNLGVWIRGQTRVLEGVGLHIPLGLRTMSAQLILSPTVGLWVHVHDLFTTCLLSSVEICTE